MPFTVQQGCIKDQFVTEEELIDRFTGQELWMWSKNNYGQLGNNTTIPASSPVQTISGGTNWRQVSLGAFHAGAIKTDGTLWMWGFGQFGRLGNNSTVYTISSPVQTISGGNNWKQVDGGQGHTAAIKTDGTLWLWGNGCSGRLGTNSTVAQSSPVQTISGGTNWKQVSAGYCNSAGIKTDGTLWVWGFNGNGRLGTNSTVAQSSPVQTISGGTNWKQVSLGYSNGAAIKTDGTLWLWGCGGYGWLGNNTTISVSSPVQTISGGTNWKQVSGGAAHAAAIKTDGTLWLWGNGCSGRLGTNSTVAQSSPVQTISGGTNWKQVNSSFYNSAAIKTDGTLWLWGSGLCGRLGNNTEIFASSPVQTISRGTNWKSVSIGYHTAATRITEF